MTREAVFDRMRDVLARDERVRLALVFGSVARAAAGRESDIDVAVDEEGADLARLSAELTQASGHEAQVVSLRDPGVPLLEEILRDGIVVYERRPHAYASWRAHAIADLEIDRPWYARMRDAWLRRVAERGLGDGQP